MIRKMFSILLTLAILLSSAQAGSQENLRVVFVEVERVFRESSLIGQIREQIEEEFSDQAQAIRKLIENIQERRDKLSKEGLTLSSEETNGLRQEIDRFEVLLQREDEALREDRNLRFSEFREKLEPEIFRLISNVAKEGEHEMVLDSVVVLYGATEANVTDQVIDMLDKNITLEQLMK